MDFKQLSQKAIELRTKYSELEMKKYGKKWTRENRIASEKTRP